MQRRHHVSYYVFYLLGYLKYTYKATKLAPIYHSLANQSANKAMGGKQSGGQGRIQLKVTSLQKKSHLFTANKAEIYFFLLNGGSNKNLQIKHSSEAHHHKWQIYLLEELALGAIRLVTGRRYRIKIMLRAVDYLNKSMHHDKGSQVFCFELYYCWQAVTDPLLSESVAAWCYIPIHKQTCLGRIKGQVVTLKAATPPLFPLPRFISRSWF